MSVNRPTLFLVQSQLPDFYVVSPNMHYMPDELPKGDGVHPWQGGFTLQEARVAQWFTPRYPQLAFLTKDIDLRPPYLHYLDCGENPFHIEETEEGFRLNARDLKGWETLEGMLKHTRDIVYGGLTASQRPLPAFEIFPLPKSCGYDVWASSEAIAQRNIIRSWDAFQVLMAEVAYVISLHQNAMAPMPDGSHEMPCPVWAIQVETRTPYDQNWTRTLLATHLNPYNNNSGRRGLFLCAEASQPPLHAGTLMECRVPIWIRYPNSVLKRRLADAFFENYRPPSELLYRGKVVNYHQHPPANTYVFAFQPEIAQLYKDTYVLPPNNPPAINYFGDNIPNVPFLPAVPGPSGPGLDPKSLEGIMQWYFAKGVYTVTTLSSILRWRIGFAGSSRWWYDSEVYFATNRIRQPPATPREVSPMSYETFAGIMGSLDSTLPSCSIAMFKEIRQFAENILQCHNAPRCPYNDRPLRDVSALWDLSGRCHDMIMYVQDPNAGIRSIVLDNGIRVWGMKNMQDTNSPILVSHDPLTITTWARLVRGQSDWKSTRFGMQCIRRGISFKMITYIATQHIEPGHIFYGDRKREMRTVPLKMHYHNFTAMDYMGYWNAARRGLQTTDMGAAAIQDGGILWRLTVHYANHSDVFKVPTGSMKMEGSFVHMQQNGNPSYAYLVSRHLHKDEEELILGMYTLQGERKSDYLVLVFVILIRST